MIRTAVILLLLTALVWLSCTQQRQPCLDPVRASMILQMVHFKTDTSTKTIDTSLPSPVFYPVSLQQNDTSFFGAGSTFTLSLSPDTGFCQWLFTTVKGGAMDTLSFYYKRKLEFLSNACGFTYFYSLDSVLSTHKIVDSARVLNATVNNNINTKHVQVFIHPGY